MREATACVPCRKRKRKCIAAQPDHPCSNCVKLDITCNLTNLLPRQPPFYDHAIPTATQDARLPVSHSASNAIVEPDSSAVSSSNVDLKPAGSLPGVALQLDLANLYFDYIHDQFHAIFHKPSIMELIEDGKAPPVLILGMIALSARFAVHPMFASIPPKERGIPYAQEAEKLFNLHDISLTTIQASILLGAFWTGQGDPALESVYICIATRMGQLLDISSRPTATPAERELNLRIWWSLCMIDVWTSHGMRLPPGESRLNGVPQPIDEPVFLQHTPFELEADPSQCMTSLPLLVEMVKLNRILAEINELNKDAVEGGAEGHILENRVDGLSLKLDEWLQALPDYMRDTPENLARYASVGLGRVFVALYCGYYHFGQLLYYQFLHHANHDPSWVTAHSYALRCKAHAAALCEIIYASHSTPGCDVLYTMIGHVLVIASTVQIHSLLFSSSDEEIKIARSRLERNFEILLHLYSFWPTLAMSLLRLKVFHTACHKSTITSFVMDQWMLQFLGEFGRAVHERKEPFPEDIPLSLGGIGLTPILDA